jgi:hypothetical protein
LKKHVCCFFGAILHQQCCCVFCRLHKSMYGRPLFSSLRNLTSHFPICIIYGHSCQRWCGTSSPVCSLRICPQSPQG